MSAAWETTVDDVNTVLNRYGVTVTPERLAELHEGLDLDAIEEGLLHYCNMDAQTSSMLDDIEKFLMEEGVIPKGEPKFFVDPADAERFESDETEELEDA